MQTDQANYDIQEVLDDYARHVSDKEIRIINAAINAFSEKGFKYTKTREIAERAGVAEGTIFRYFKTKDAILEKMVPLLVKVMQPRLEAPIVAIIHDNGQKSIDAVLCAILLDRLQIIRDNGRFLKSVVPELFHRAPLLNQLKENLLPLIKRYIQQILDHAKQRGEIDQNVRADIATEQLLGFVLAYSLINDLGDEEAVKRDIHDFVHYTMRGWK